MLKNFLIFLKSLSNVNSIEIFNRWHRIFLFIDINYFCSMISSNIKHLDIDIFDIDHIEILIDKLENVSSFKFKFAFDKSNRDDVQESSIQTIVTLDRIVGRRRKATLAFL
ncbi:unnamed protein product [Rotaria sordida]|uniref:Uncharacterized protein n=1 Tax=Rotaria sordida TaxID=392033 RepID=A0A815E841_9BILA|nr:unnamed protein product [Rotaria sordida]